MKTKTGRFYGIGLGPGDPDLITVKARRLLRRCSVLCMPKGRENTEGLALSLLKKIKPAGGQELIALSFPMTTDTVRLDAAWNDAATVIAAKLTEGKDVAFLTEGDPMLYSTFIHVLRSLKRLYPEAAVETVPGVSSITAAAARSLTPLGTGDETLLIAPAVNDEGCLEDILSRGDTVVFLKVNRAFDALLALLERKGLVGKAVLVTRCFMKDENVVRDIREMKGKKLDYFSLVIVTKK